MKADDDNAVPRKDSRGELPDWPALLDKQSAADYTSLSVRTIERLLASGAVMAKRIGRRTIRLRRSDLDRWIDELPAAKRGHSDV